MQATITWFAFIAVLCDQRTRAEEGPIVQTEYGLVRGQIREAIGSQRPVFSYFGVQYGRSPDYVFRFRPAEDPWGWDGVRNATNEDRPLCVQDTERCGSAGLQKHTFLRHIMPEMNTQEHCLFLDIFTPRRPNSFESGMRLLPVIIWLPGGSMKCFASSTKMWVLPAYEDVVLVQVQYRVDLFGFFTTEDKWAPPNIAFHDHLKAMEWVRRNIRAFGGDPDLVTLMGESAGALSSTAHTLIPASSGLFHRVFAASGAPDIMPWKPTYGDAVRRIAEKLNCYFGDSAATSTCLRNKVGTSTLMNAAGGLNIEFSMLEDHALFPGRVRDLIESKSFQRAVPTMIGFTNDEMNFLLSRHIFADIYFKGAGATRSEVESSLHQFLTYLYPEDKTEEIASVAMNEYCNPLKVGQTGMALFRGFLDLISDGWFASRIVRFAEKMKEAGQPVYFYKFGLKPSMYKSRPEEFVRPHNFSTMDHADDLLYMFGFPFVPDLAGGENPALVFNEEERQLSRQYMGAIAHFAKTGSPPAELNWPQFPDYVEITSTIQSKKEIRTSRMKLWNDIIEKIAFGSKPGVTQT